MKVYKFCLAMNQKYDDSWLLYYLIFVYLSNFFLLHVVYCNIFETLIVSDYFNRQQNVYWDVRLWLLSETNF